MPIVNGVYKSSNKKVDPDYAARALVWYYLDIMPRDCELDFWKNYFKSLPKIGEVVLT